MKILKIILIALGIIAILLNSLIYVFPEEVTPKSEWEGNPALYHLTLHAFFIAGATLLLLALLINKKLKRRRMQVRQMDEQIDSITI